MRLKKACKRDLNEPEYWKRVSNVNKPSLFEFLKYRKEKIQYHLEACAASAADEKLAHIFKSLNMGPIRDFHYQLTPIYINKSFKPIDVLITDELHTFLTNFFNVDHDPEGWDDAVEELTIDDKESQIMKNTKKLLKRTLIQFFKAFSLNALNPLRGLTTLEKPHLNQFVHPIIDLALWIFGKINYIYGDCGEIPLQGQILADGIGYINDVTNHDLICGDCARPGASTRKHTNDDIKNIASMVRLYNSIIIAEANSLNQLYVNLRTHGLRGVYRLFEVDCFKDWSDMPKFVYVYETVIK